MPAAPVVMSGKLAALMQQMLRELASEGRRVLVFSQFTSKPDLIKPELVTAEIDHVTSLAAPPAIEPTRPAVCSRWRCQFS